MANRSLPIVTGVLRLSGMVMLSGCCLLLDDFIRSLQNFRINQPLDRMPAAVIRAYGMLKGSAAAVNAAHHALGD